MRQEWKMTYDAWKASRLELLRSRESPCWVGGVETTLEQLLRDKRITKKQYQRARWGGLTQAQSEQMHTSRTMHQSTVRAALMRGETVPADVLAEYPQLVSEFFERIENRRD